MAAGVAAGVSEGHPTENASQSELVVQIEQLNDYANCFTNVTVPPPTQFGSLDYGVYASIVGSCAYAPGGCPVSQQNLVDLVYGQISGAGLTTYPP